MRKAEMKAEQKEFRGGEVAGLVGERWREKDLEAKDWEERRELFYTVIKTR